MKVVCTWSGQMTAVVTDEPGDLHLLAAAGSTGVVELP